MHSCIPLILRVVGQEGLVGVRPTSCPELLLTDLLIFVQSILGKSGEISTVHASPLMVRVESSLTCLGTVSTTGPLSLAESVLAALWHLG